MPVNPYAPPTAGVADVVQGFVLAMGFLAAVVVELFSEHG